MSSPWEPYEELQRYPVDEVKRIQLFTEQIECAVAWTTGEGWPVGVMHWFLWREGRFWVTVMNKRSRVSALRERPESCVIVSSAGTDLGPVFSVTAKTRATVHDDQETRVWFAHALAEKAYSSNPPIKEQFRSMLSETKRAIIELEPVQYISYDAAKMAGALNAAGLLKRT
jgi:hypothetical protein